MLSQIWKAVVRSWVEAGSFVCEVSDRGRLDDPLAGRVRPTATQPDGRGLWMIQQLSDLVQVRAVVDGQAIRMRFALL